MKTDNATNIIDRAIVQAESWIAVGAGFGLEQSRIDHRLLLIAFHEAVCVGDFLDALGTCATLARKWASGDRSGFSLLDALCSGVGETLDIDNGRVMGFERDTSGEWGVLIAWDGNVSTVETVERAAELGAWDDDAVMVLGLRA